MVLRHMRLVLLIFLACSWLGLESRGTLQAEEVGQEYQVKAAFLVNMAKFITWPEDAFPPDTPEFIFCLAGVDPFNGLFDVVKSKTIGTRPIRVVRIASLDNIPPCHMLFISRSEVGRLGNLAAVLERRPIVTISDIDGFIKAGGTIEFITKNNRLSFMINNTALKQRSIHASASLLDLAATVQ